MDYIAVLLPPIVVGLLFWFAMKSIFNADKSERQAEGQRSGFRGPRGLITLGKK